MTPTPRTAKATAPPKGPVKTAAKASPKPAADVDAAAEELLSEPEIAAIRAQLETDVVQMEIEYKQSMEQLNELQRTNTDGAGDDQADAGSKTFEREQEQSIANNRHDLLIQTQRAIERIDAKTYGRCEVCGKPIPKERLKAIPMATLDAACKAREERR